MLRPLALTACLLALALPAAGQQKADRPAPPSPEFALPPSLLEGFYVTLEEIRRNSRQVFNHLSGDGESPIPRDTFVSAKLPANLVPPAKQRALLERLFDMLDADGNGRLTRHEWDERIAMDLEFADQNDDGKITLKELSRAKESMGLGDMFGALF